MRGERSVSSEFSKFSCSMLKSGPKKRCDGVDGNDAVSMADSSSQTGFFGGTIGCGGFFFR